MVPASGGAGYRPSIPECRLR